MKDKDTPRRILLAHKNSGTREVLHSILQEALGHDVLLSTDKGQELCDAFKRDIPDLVVSSIYLEDGDAIQYLIDACREEPRPSIIVTTRADLEHVEHALEDHVMSYLVEPVTADDLRPSIYLVLRRFEEFQSLREEVEDLSQALEARKVIEKAKGVLMKTKGLEESDAYKRLQQLANQKRKKLVEVAEAVLLAEQL